jgi:hypothetical protein
MQTFRQKFVRNGRYDVQAQDGGTVARPWWLRVPPINLDLPRTQRLCPPHASGVLPESLDTVCPCYTPSMAAPRTLPDDPPPFLGSWRRVYGAVLLYLAALIGVLYLFTQAYR